MQLVRLVDLLRLRVRRLLLQGRRRTLAIVDTTKVLLQRQQRSQGVSVVVHRWCRTHLVLVRA